MPKYLIKSIILLLIISFTYYWVSRIIEFKKEITKKEYSKVQACFIASPDSKKAEFLNSLNYMLDDFKISKLEFKNLNNEYYCDSLSNKDKILTIIKDNSK